jgi:hypothetical protein
MYSIKMIPFTMKQTVLLYILKSLFLTKSQCIQILTKGEVTISNVALDKAYIYNSAGQLVRKFMLDSTDNTNNLSGLTKGVYYI